MNQLKNYVLLLTIIILGTILNAQNKVFDVEIKGTGNPILLFPGFTCPGDVWDGVVKELSNDYECHVFTFAGFGGMPAIKKPWLPKIKEAISFYISEEQLKAPTLIGHSLGGTLALWLATEKKHNFNKIIVVDALASTGALMMPNFDANSITYDNPYSQQMLNMDENSFKAMADQMAKGMSLNQEKQDLITKWMVESDRETYVYGYTDLLKLDLREDLTEIKTPVIILAATQPYGLGTVRKTYAKQYEKLKDYNIKFAENSAHFIMFDQPKWLIEAIISEL